MAPLSQERRALEPRPAGGHRLGARGRPAGDPLAGVRRPLVVEPRREGFGSRVIERSLPRGLGAPATLRFAPDGVTCAIRAVLA
jgi:hypothetical protein